MTQIILFFLFYSFAAWSYPELSRHGYANCTACHISPSGGGVLNLYGRELSKELVSTWGVKGEQKPFYGLINLPENVFLQSYVRTLQLYRKTPSVSESRTIFMQADLEGAVQFGKLTLDASIGRQEKQVLGQKQIDVIYRRHFAQYQVNDQIIVRGGKFSRYFGLNTPYHTNYTQRDLAFGQDTETYNAEFAYYKDKISIFATLIQGTLGDKTSYATEKAQTLSMQYYQDNQKVGFSYYKGKDENQSRDVIGPWAILKLPKNFFFATETYFQKKNPNSGEIQKGYTNSNRLSFEPFKGFIPFLTFEASNINWYAKTTKKQAYGTGIQFFPRPHFELMTMYQKDRLYLGKGYFADTFWFMLNFYL